MVEDDSEPIDVHSIGASLHAAFEGVYRRYPAGIGNVIVPMRSRAEALCALSLYAPNRRRAIAMHGGVWLSTALLGPKAVPGARTTIDAVVEPRSLRDILFAAVSCVGAVDGFALYVRTQQDRPGYAMLLLHRGVAVAFAKVTRDAAVATRERDALACLRDARPVTFCAPTLLGSNAVAEWWITVTRAAHWRVHVPARGVDVTAVAHEVQAALAGLVRPTGTPSHWEPMHGDLTPWNLRRAVAARNGPPVLIDWEDAAWGPPHADAVRYKATAAALSDQRVEWRRTEHEARVFWLDRLPSTGHRAREESFRSSLRHVLLAGVPRGDPGFA